MRCTRSAGRVCSDYWKGVILHLRVRELQLYTIINFCLAPIRFHSTLDVSTVTVHGSRLAIQHVLSCQSEPPSQAACLRPTTRPINSYWLWHTCPSKMSSSVLIFPESCSLPSPSPTLSCPPRVRSLSWQIVYVASYSERRCFAARWGTWGGSILAPAIHFCILATCSQQRALSETINRPGSLVFRPQPPGTRQSNGAA